VAAAASAAAAAAVASGINDSEYAKEAGWNPTCLRP